MRTYQHVIDSKAVKTTINSIPDRCVVRGLSERDYGIDLMIEIFKLHGIDEHGHEIYDSSGHICYLQIKGTNSEIRVNSKTQAVHFQIERKLLFYVEKFPVPFILIRTCTQEGKEKVYFIWLQRYIIEVLDIESPDWRTKDQESYTLRIPASNILSRRFDKIEAIAARIKYVEEFSEYFERYQCFNGWYQGLLNGSFTNYPLMLAELNRIKHLGTLLNYNNCCINPDCINELITYIKDLRDGKIVPPANIEDFPHYFNLDLLHSSNQSQMFIETFVAENSLDTVY